MLDMCKYNMASQHDSTTQVLYLKAQRAIHIITQVWVTRPSIQVIQTIQANSGRDMSEYRHLVK